MERVYTNYDAAGRQVVLNRVPASFANITDENIRVIINETQRKVLASSMKKNQISSVLYDNVARKVTVTLDSSVPAIVSTDKLTIKIDMGDSLYETALNERENIMGGVLPKHEIPHLGAAFSDDDECTACPVIEGDADYRVNMDDYATDINEDVQVGMVFKVTGEDDEDDMSFLVPRILGSDAELTYENGLSLSVGTGGEWLTPQKGKCYRVKSLRVMSDVGDLFTMTVATYEEVPEGKSGREIFEEVKQNSGDPLIRQFFGLPQALPSQYHEMGNTEVLEIADEEWLAMYGFVAVPNTLHTVNPLGQQVEIATYFKPSRTYGDYGFPELWAQNDQQQWVSILNDYPTADRDIYTFNPSNNE